MTMSGDPKSPSSRGHLILKSHSPLPQFRCAIPVPQSSALVSQLRNTVLAILTGQATAKDPSSSVTPNSTDAGLSYSEHLKQQTLHEWRLKGLVLELKQNALIAPETRQHMDDETNGEHEQRGTGFVLADDHECALLEHGDEINIWLREGQEIESLRLPKLSSRHEYGLPNQPSLTRSGTLLGPPPPYTSIQEEYEFGVPSATLIEPREPSSHSSSVSAHPNGQYETTMRHKSTPAGWHRVMYLNNNNDANGVNNNTTTKPARRSKPKRLMSEGSNGLVDQTPKPTRRNSSNVPAKPPIIKESNDGIVSEVRRSPLHSPPTSPSISNKEILMSQAITESGPSKAARAEREKLRKAGQKSMPSQALIIGPGVQGKVGRVNSGGESSNKGAITPPAEGVEAGEYGNMEAFVSFTAASSEVHQIKSNAPLGSRRMSSRSGTSGKDERLAKITEAARASGEGQNGSNGRASGASLASGLATNNGGNGEDNNTKTGKSKPIFKKYVKLPEKPELPPIRNLLPFEKDDGPASETLMPMPEPSPALIPPVNDATPGSSQQSERELQLTEDAALARALAESLTYERSPSTSNPPTPGLSTNNRSMTASPAQLIQSRPQNLARKSSSSAEASKLLNRKTSNDASKLEQKRSSTQQMPGIVRQKSGGAISNGSGGKGDEVQLSKAEKRYNEVKKALEAEKNKQAEQERNRKEKAQKEREEREKFLQKIEHERRQKQEKARWEVWEEVRSRQTKEQSR
ncbi:uncharacterized protein FA14DRAFT_159908 [Meira miltonrushii]|uniref:Uncharacterized protein n=1 Tax=Meira miltonrushii TaxID=1280837 RepID=A0A316VQ28_9BASI|nr:uncharacterized protein FA14DRAFT_159908 [Meira miltonrushii]PWN38261.1 hypothetical protein FA14DRAFT_159908 [Meira miltonrushii]